MGWVGNDINAADHRCTTLAAPNTFAGKMQGRQRRRTCGIDGHAWAVQIEKIRDPVSDGPVGRIAAMAYIMIVHDTNKHTHAVIELSQIIAGNTSFLEQCPHGFEKNPLLGIRDFRFDGRHGEKQGIELVHVLQETTPFCIAASYNALTLRIVKLPPVPTISGDLANTISPLTQVIPKFIKIIRTGIASAHTDNGNFVLITERRLRVPNTLLGNR